MALGTGIYVYGCADGWWGYSYVSSFTPEAFADKSYKPLFYAPEEKFYDYAQLEYIEKDREDILLDWQHYLGSAFPKNKIAFYLLNDSAAAEIEQLYRALQGDATQQPGLLASKKAQNFVQFLHYAKAVEASSTTTFSSWDYEDRIVVQTQPSLVADIETFYQNLEKPDAFFANRIWFQVLKAKFYSNDRGSVIPFFEASANKQPKNDLYYRALGYVAGAYYQQSAYDKSNALFASIFNDAPSKRHEALYNFRPLSTDSLHQALQRVDSKAVQASMVAMNGYYHDAAEAMKRIYAIQANSPHLDFLLTRWVNAEESKVTDYYNVQKSNATWDASQIDKETLNWLGEILKQPRKLHNPGLAYLAYGYINMLCNEHDVAQVAYSKAKRFGRGKPLVAAQIRLFNLLNNISQLGHVSAKNEKELLPELTWLYHEVPKDSVLIPSFRYEYASSWIKTALSAVYTKNDNPLMAELLDSKKGFYDNEELGDRMVQFLLQENKSGWNTLFATLYPYNLSDIYESRAIYAYYQDHIDEAIDLMERATSPRMRNDRGYNDMHYNNAVLRGNPFNGKIKDCNDCDHAAPQKVKYTKLDFLRKVQELKQNVDQGTDLYANALLLGNAYYNTSFFGNARVFYYNAIIAEYGNYISTKNQPYILGMSNAKKYYEKAFHAAQDNEQRAKVSYLLAKVDRNNFYRQQYLQADDYYWADAKQTMFKDWAGFQTLKNDYADTKYYQEVIRECGYFRSYVTQEIGKGR
ncbi:hypothetical protein GCM10017764_29120 [Sphingobacterium griseoflavum]|uniref:Uncharacterized protein n=2 Tax=Sphingobacterium griseoflavum TaxID=1474952 RepID=A0ABQ3HXQ2_9SPHI|nr:hypothetical protein GCM10017764_29120 [Sphingobacterium griseoflavum]